MAPLNEPMTHDAARNYARAPAQKQMALKPDRYLLSSDPAEDISRLPAERARQYRRLGIFTPGKIRLSGCRAGDVEAGRAGHSGGCVHDKELISGAVG